MIARSLLTGFTLASLLISAMPARGQIVNGSFETPTVPNGGFTGFLNGSTAITGWTVVGADVAIISGTFMQSGITFQAQSGAQWLDLSGTQSNTPSTGVRQLVSTVTNQVYALNFYVGSTTGGGSFFPATVDLSINGGARTSYFNPTGPSNMLDWKLFTVEFTATSPTTDITFFNGSASNNFSTGLDNVSLTAVAVPEPSSIFLGLLGLGTVGVVIRTHRKKSRLRRKHLKSTNRVTTITATQ